MKTKFSLLAFLLLPSLSFALTGTDGTTCYSDTGNPAYNSLDINCGKTAPCICSVYIGRIIPYVKNNISYKVIDANSIASAKDGYGYYHCTNYYNYTSVVANDQCPALIPPLSSYDNDASGCSKAGGTFMSVGTEQVGGTYYGASFFGGQGIMLGGDIHAVTKCGTTADVVGEVVSTALNLMPLVSSLFKNSAVKKMANTAVLDKLQELPYFGGGNNMPDYNVGLPKLPSPSDIAGGNSSPHVPVTPSDVPTVVTPDGNLPSRAPQINSDSNYANISDVFVPTKTNGDALIDYSIVDRFNTFNKIPDSGIPMSQILPNVGSSSLSVKETFDFSNIIQNSTIPSDIATVPTVTTKSTTYSNTDLVEIYTTTKTYPDNSSSNQVLTLNTVSKVGEIKTTTLSPTGDTSTVYKPIQVPNWSNLSTIDQWTVQNAPNITATTNDGGATSTAPTTSPVTNPDVVNNQSSADIINAKMPSYTLQDTGDFETYDKNIISQMIDDSSTMIGNIKNQYDAAKTIYDNTENLIKNGWEPPQLSPGQCGSSLTMNWHGSIIDLCPPITQNLTTISPVISLLVTIAGSIIAIGIFIAGF